VLEKLGSPERTRRTFFEVADLHAFTTGFADPQAIRDARDEMVIDCWLPASTRAFGRVSAIGRAADQRTAHAALDDRSVSWLQRVPTYKDQLEELVRRSRPTLLGYPLLQLCDIAAFAGDTVPVGATSSRISSSAARSCAGSTTCTARR